MSLLPICPCCGGLMVGKIHTTLTSACRCGYPEKVTWDDFKQFRDADPETGDPMLKKKRRAA